MTSLAEQTPKWCTCGHVRADHGHRLIGWGCDCGCKRFREARQPDGCICIPPVRNDIAWHHATCPWRILRRRGAA